MKELEGLFDWLNSFNRPEQGCDSLIEWLELEQKAAWSRAGEIFGKFVVGSFFTIAGAITGLYLTMVRMMPMNQTHPTNDGIAAGLAVFALGVAVALYVSFSGLFMRRRLLKSSRNADALKAIAHLRNVTGYRGLRRELGEHGVIELNEGASLYLRCRSVLTSEAWTTSSPDDPWIEARDGMLRAMESAMERLTVFVTKKRSFVEIAPVLEEMRTATNEAVRITDQRSLQAGSTGRDLRSSLARMKELAVAEEELLRLNDGR